MPGSDVLRGCFGEPQESEPILSTLPLDIADELTAAGVKVQPKISDNHAMITAEANGRVVVVDFFFGEHNRLTALVSHGVDLEPGDPINAPDVGLARDVLALLGGGR